MEAVCCSETSVNVYDSARCRIQEGNAFQVITGQQFWCVSSRLFNYFDSRKMRKECNSLDMMFSWFYSVFKQTMMWSQSFMLLSHASHALLQKIIIFAIESGIYSLCILSLTRKLKFRVSYLELLLTTILTPPLSFCLYQNDELALPGNVL
jgi:hypothetical protein